jgi:hypothetical protein
MSGKHTCLIIGLLVLLAGGAYIWVMAFRTTVVAPAKNAIAAKSQAQCVIIQANVHGALMQYQLQHNASLPTLARFVAQMTQSTSADGSPGTEIPPALPAIPKNPFTNGNKVGSGPVGTSDWFYDEQTGEFRASDSAEHAGH